MRTRLIFVLPGVEAAQEIERELLLARIEDRHMHFMAKRGTDLGDLPEASVAQKSDFKHGIWTGLVFGGGLGAVFGFVISLVPPMDSALGLGAVLLFALLGASFGIWASSMIASSIPNSELTGYDEALDAGKVLLMVDVPHDRVEDITNLVGTRHPDVLAGTDPRMPAFPFP